MAGRRRRRDDARASTPLGGQLIAWLNKLTPAEGFNVGAMLQNRGEFALILATLAAAAGLDPRLTPFAGLYVLIMAIIGPVLAVNSERIGARGLPHAEGEDERRRSAATASATESIALVEAAIAGADDRATPSAPRERCSRCDRSSPAAGWTPRSPARSRRPSRRCDDRVSRQSGLARDAAEPASERQRDPEY